MPFGLLRRGALAALLALGAGPALAGDNPPGARPAPIILAQVAVAASVTGSTAEVTLATVTLPAHRLGPNGRLRITTLWSWTSNTNTKTPRIRLAGTAFFAPAIATASLTGRYQTEIANRGSEASQVAYPASAGTGGWHTSTVATVTSTIDTTQDQAITITGQLGTSTDTLTLESYVVEVLPG